MEIVKHSFNPIINNDSKILILGSFPSIISRNNNFYYANKNNRFWKVLSAIFNVDLFNASIDEKTTFLLNKKIALYDVVYQCEITNSSDALIKNVTPVNIEKLIKNTNIKKIYLNGSKAYDLFIKYNPSLIKIAEKLPSTSSANAKYSLNDLIDKYRVIQSLL